MKNNLQNWQKLSVISIFLFIVKVIRINWAVIPAVFVILKDYDFSDIQLILGISVIFILLLTVSFLYYYYFSFRLIDSELQIRSGIFSRKITTISFDRIQSLNTKQNIIFRLFKIVQVTIDTAGSSMAEAQLPGIRLEQLKEIKHEIYSSVKFIEKSTGEAEKKKSILNYSIIDFFKIGIASNRFFIALAVLWATYNAISENMNDLLNINIDDKVFEIADQFDTSNLVSFLIFSFIATIGLFLIFSFTAAIISYFDFRLVYENETFRKKAGLFAKKEDVLSVHKVQTVRIKQNILQKLLKHFEIVLKQAKSSLDISEDALFKIPLSNQEFSKNFLQRYFSFTAENDFQKISKKYIRKYWLMFSLYPSVLLTIVLYFIVGSYAFLGLFPGAFGYGAFYLRHKKHGFVVTDDLIKIRHGFFAEQVIYLEPYKVQSLEVRQSPYQRRNGLASLTLYTAAESLTIPYIEESVLYEMYDRIILIIEKTEKKWF